MALSFWLNDGKIVVDATGKPVVCETCPCDEDAPCICPEGLAAYYRLKDYSDGDLSVGGDCSVCTDAIPSDAWFAQWGQPRWAYTFPAWDGTFYLAPSPFECWWFPSNSLSISGKIASWVSGTGSGTALLLWSDSSCYWELTIICYAVKWQYPGWFSGGGGGTIWTGKKRIGVTPVGVYERTFGCDVTSTLEIEACP